jgi:ATP-binding cassette subfamily F protein 3
MSLLTTHNLTKFYGAEEIFSDISVEIPHKARVALVGPNGAGKTTLLHLLIGLDISTEGSINKAKDTRLAYLPQRPELAGTHTLWEEQLHAFTDLRQMEAELHELAQQMADPTLHDAALEKYTALQAEFEHRNGYTYETRIRMVLTGVGFREEDYHTPLPQLSGGQKTRAMLARLLLEEPDVLVLDEPTNHLDIQAVEWLEDFLQSFPGAVLAVSHDRYFMDNFATTIWEMEFGRLTMYRGNYSHYVRQHEDRDERLQKEYDAQQAFVSKEMDYIRKHMGSRWTAQAKGRLKKLETMQKRGKLLEGGARHRQSMHLRIQESHRSGNIVLRTKNLAVGYPDDELPLFYAPDITLLRGETAAIIGPNGAGKSTLLKTLIGQLAPLAGETMQGAGVKIGYFAQAHEELTSSNTLVDEIYRIKPMPLSEARNYLGMFLFSGDDVFRTVDTLSGGERGRVALAKLALGGANLLLLDEPTNHLDIDSQEILQAVLEDFNGTILLVSHDRYLVDALASQIWDVNSGKMTVYSGTYREYVAYRNQQKAASQISINGSAKRQAAQYAEKVHGMTPAQLKKRIADIEKHIETLEHKMKEIELSLETASTAGDTRKVKTLGEQYTQTEQALETALEEWGMLAE